MGKRKSAVQREREREREKERGGGRGMSSSSIYLKQKNKQYKRKSVIRHIKYMIEEAKLVSGAYTIKVEYKY